MFQLGLNAWSLTSWFVVIGLDNVQRMALSCAIDQISQALRPFTGIVKDEACFERFALVQAVGKVVLEF